MSLHVYASSNLWTTYVHFMYIRMTFVLESTWIVFKFIWRFRFMYTMYSKMNFCGAKDLDNP